MFSLPFLCLIVHAVGDYSLVPIFSIAHGFPTSQTWNFSYLIHHNGKLIEVIIIYFNGILLQLIAPLLHEFTLNGQK